MQGTYLITIKTAGGHSRLKTVVPEKNKRKKESTGQADVVARGRIRD